MIPHHPILGHLAVIGKLLADMPSDAHGDYMMVLIQDNWRSLFPGCDTCPPVVYLDLWPFSTPIILSLHPDISAQFTQDFNLDKPPEHARFLYPLTRNLDVSSSNGAQWKIRRKRLNPSFSPQSIIARVPDLIDEVEVCVDQLRQKAGENGQWGDVFPLQDMLIYLTLDVIGRFAL
jgi:cytochrome P450